MQTVLLEEMGFTNRVPYGRCNKEGLDRTCAAHCVIDRLKARILAVRTDSQGPVSSYYEPKDGVV